MEKFIKPLAGVLKKPSTQLVNQAPETCPACQCVRFERVPRIRMDRWLGRTARYLCIKCEKTTIVVENHATEGRSEKTKSSLDAETTPQARKLFVEGMKYSAGDGVKKCEKTAFGYFRKAAELGHTRAKVNTAIYLLRGTGTAQNIEDSCQWLELASQEGNAKANLLLPRVKKLLSTSW